MIIFKKSYIKNGHFKKILKTKSDPNYTKTHHIEPLKKKFSEGGGGMPPNPHLNRAIHPASGMYISPRYYPPHV